MSVRRIAGWHNTGLIPEEIVRKFGHFSLAQVHAALAYYHANQVEIDADFEAESRRRWLSNNRIATDFIVRLAYVVAGSSTQSGTLLVSPTVQIGGQAAQVAFAGLISPGLYQFNVIVPPAATDGDNAVTAVYEGASICTVGFIPVQGSN